MLFMVKMRLSCDVMLEVEADSEDEAEEAAMSTEHVELIENAIDLDLEVIGVSDEWQ